MTEREDIDDMVTRMLAVTPEVVRGWVSEAVVLAIPLAMRGTRRMFANAVGPDGRPWPKLAHARPGGTVAPDVPLSDTGSLQKSITGQAIESSLVLSTDHRAARLQNFGGTIVPVNAEFLCIPATAKAKEAKSPRNYPDELYPRINRSRTKGVLMAEGDDPDGRTGRGDGWHVAYYMTIGPVVIPKREFLGFDDATVGEILDLTLDHVLDKWFYSESRR